MRSHRINRNDFASLISDLRIRRDVSSGARYGDLDLSPEARGLIACWSDEPSLDSLPRLVVIPDEELDDFLAWAAAFLPSFRPLTAFMRVLPWNLYTMSLDVRRETDARIVPVLAGAALGEVMMNATGRGFLETLPSPAFESTFSATLGRVLMNGLSSSVMERASEGWHRARILTEQTARRAIPESLSDVWSVVLRLADYQGAESRSSRRLDAIYAGCQEIRDGGIISRSTLDQVSRGRIGNSSYEDAMAESKERRVEVFEKAAESLMREVPDEISTSFLVGYLASLVSGGSVEHAPLVFPLQDRLPTAMLWYGICAGLHPTNRVLTDYGNLGLRIVRSMNRDETVLSLPNCDIAINELEILFRGDPRARSFRQANASFLRIEVAPTVTTTVKWPLRSGNPGQMNLFGGEERQATPDRERLSELVVSLRESLSLAEAILGGKPRYSTIPSAQQRGKKRR